MSLIGYLATIVTGAGVGGWAYPDLPLVGATVQRIVNATRTSAPASPVAEAIHDVVSRMAQTHTLPPGSLIDQALSDRLTPSFARGPVAATAAVGARPVSTGGQRFATTGDTISIASYNIQVFGESKLGKSDVMKYLVQIVRRFDLVAIQEVRARSDAIIPDFVGMINADGGHYSYIIGPRLGRTNSKEQYAFVFNTDRIEVDPRSVLTIDDPADNLHREPLLARFRVRTADPAQGFTFWLMNAHTDPDEVPQELDALAAAFTSVQQQGWGEDDVILLGDLNASEQQLGRLGTLPGMRYAIGGVPTNTRGNKTYDNLLFDGRTTVEFSGQAGVANVMQAFGLTMDQALEISDHMPVWAVFSAYEGGRAGQVVAQQPPRAAMW
jgi:endonuclease/exonuclease/phosphatase family metal-dependent hydrolase